VGRDRRGWLRNKLHGSLPEKRWPLPSVKASPRHGVLGLPFGEALGQTSTDRQAVIGRLSNLLRQPWNDVRVSQTR